MFNESISIEIGLKAPQERTRTQAVEGIPHKFPANLTNYL